MTYVILFKILILFYLWSANSPSEASSIDVIISDQINNPEVLSLDGLEYHNDVDNDNTIHSTASYNLDLIDSCRVFLAPSTIPGAGMGIFAGKDFRKDDEVTTGDGVVPLLDLHWNNDVSEFVNDFLWDEYTWSSDTFSGMDIPGIQIEGASFGIGALPNCFFPRLNVYDSEATRDNGSIEPGVDPGSGAFTVYHNRRGIASRRINTGEEIFVDYGYSYFDGDRQSKYGLMPFLENYRAADRLLKAFRTSSQKLEKMISSTNWYSIRDTDSKAFDIELYYLAQSVIKTWPSRTQGALPATVEGVNYVLDKIGSTKFIHNQRSTRDIDWLKQNGVCIDHLVVRNSKIPNAGRGAFVNKFLPRGSIIAPVPLIHLPNRDVLNIYDSHPVPNSLYTHYERNKTNIIHHQLMLNYCFGHRDSSLLLCPYGIASSFVNHGSSRKNHANTKIVWSNTTTSRPEWLDMTLDQWAYTYQSGLAFEYIALRDIDEGEEILIDYGTEWESAWEEHVTKWTPKPFRSQLLNEKEPPIEIPNQDDWPWPDVQLWCSSIYRNIRRKKKLDNAMFPCRIVSKVKDRLSGQVVYTAEIIKRYHGVKDEGKSDDGYIYSFCREEFVEILFNVPRDGILFGNSFDWEEHHQYNIETWSFRHDLRIPDHLMPNKWKNLLHK